MDVKETFKNLGLTCRNESSYRFKDQPCYAPATKHCHGTSNLPVKINCTRVGHSPGVRRLCPCEGESVHA